MKTTLLASRIWRNPYSMLIGSSLWHTVRFESQMTADFGYGAVFAFDVNGVP